MAIHIFFEIPVYTKIAAVYLELGMTLMRHVVQKLQLMYMNKVLWEKQGTLPFAALIEEWKALGDASMLSRADAIAELYLSSRSLRNQA